MWKKIKNLHLFVKFVIFVDFIVLVCFLVVYGPVDKARVFWITTAMETNDHQYLANIFYSEDTIKQVMSENYMDEIKEDTDVESINVGDVEPITSYTSVYEKEILDHKEDEPYKLIQFKYNGFDCHMIAIYDPTRVEVAYNSKKNIGKVLTEMVKNSGAILNFRYNNKPEFEFSESIGTSMEFYFHYY